MPAGERTWYFPQHRVLSTKKSEKRRAMLVCAPICQGTYLNEGRFQRLEGPGSYAGFIWAKSQ